MGRHRVITIYDRKQKLKKKQIHICRIVDGIYVLLFTIALVIVGIHQHSPLYVGWGLIAMGVISIPAALFHIYITEDGWARSTLVSVNDDEAKVAVTIEILFLLGCSIVLPILGILRLLGRM